MEVKYRTEAFSGSGVRDVKDIMLYEILELGNTDILETLAAGLLRDAKCADKIITLISCIGTPGGTEVKEEDVAELCEEMLDEIKAKTGKDIQYALWLAEKEDVVNGFWRWANGAYQDDDECPDPEPEDIDAYEIGPVILSESDGDGGTLYGYEEYPDPIDPKHYSIKK